MLKLKTGIGRVEFEFDCEECGHKLSVPIAYVEAMGEPDYIECSTCGAERGHAYGLKKARERHTPDSDAEYPPMIHIDTRDLPGFVRDDLARKIGETLLLFR